MAEGQTVPDDRRQAAHWSWSSCRGVLALSLAFLLLGGCASNRPERHPQDVDKILSDNPLPPQPKFTPIHPQEAAALFNGASMQDYRIGVSDVLQVVGDTENLKAFGETSRGELIGTRVKSNGMIYLPELKPVLAAGLTVVDLQESLRKILDEDHRKGAWVSVDVLEYRSQRFFVMGAVGRAGVFPVDGTVTLVEGLSLAGALTAEADLDRAYFVRDSRVLPISIGDMLLRGKTQKNILMQHGDLVVVPHWDKRQLVYILGEVKTPGPVPFVNGHLTLAGALGAAGGIDRVKADQNVVRIFRGNWPNPLSYTLSVAEIYAYGEGIELKPGDRVLVAPAGMATASRGLELFQPFLTAFFQGIVSAGTAKNLIGD